jgi:hypothetical protein
MACTEHVFNQFRRHIYKDVCISTVYLIITFNVFWKTNGTLIDSLDRRNKDSLKIEKENIICKPTFDNSLYNDTRLCISLPGTEAK